MQYDKIITALLTATSAMTMATPATAQAKYYMRERIIGMPTASAEQGQDAPKTFRPVYADAPGACTGGIQSRPIVGCEATDRSPATISDCSAFPQSTGSSACTVKITCGPMTPYRYPGLKAGATGHMKLADNVTSPAAAQAYCDAKAKTTTEPAWCGHGSSTSQAWWYPKSVSVLNERPSSPGLYAADCS
jgi:hypothetical protein